MKRSGLPGAIVTAILVLAVLSAGILVLSSASSRPAWRTIGIVLAVALLIYRLLQRHVRAKQKEAAQPDPLSRLDLE